jgi:hypothetical protein
MTVAMMTKTKLLTLISIVLQGVNIRCERAFKVDPGRASDENGRRVYVLLGRETYSTVFNSNNVKYWLNGAATSKILSLTSTIGGSFVL